MTFRPKNWAWGPHGWSRLKLLIGIERFMAKMLEKSLHWHYLA